MIQSLRQNLERLRQRYAESGLNTFLTWWWQELMDCLPEHWREFLRYEQARLMVLPREGELQIQRLRGDKLEGELLLNAQDAELERGALDRLVGDGDERVGSIIVGLSADQVMRRRLTLPEAAAANLPQVLSFEMDRQTPFKADQVYFDSRVVRRDNDSRQLHLEIAVVPKPLVEAALARVKPLELAPDVVDGCDEKGRYGFNLRPAGLRTHQSDRRLRINLILAAGVIALVGVVMWQSLILREQAAENLLAEVELAKVEALESAELEKQVREAIEAANFLANKRKERPTSIEVIRELTQLIPDSTWLERISFVNDQIQLQGQSERADQLIGILGNARYLEAPTFQGIIQPDGQTRKERFTIMAKLRNPAAEPPAAAPVDPNSEQEASDGANAIARSE